MGHCLTGVRVRASGRQAHADVIAQLGEHESGAETTDATARDGNLHPGPVVGLVGSVRVRMGNSGTRAVVRVEVDRGAQRSEGRPRARRLARHARRPPQAESR